VTDKPIDRLWRDAVRQHIAGMDPEELAAIITETRPPEPELPKGNVIPSLGKRPGTHSGAERLAALERDGRGEETTRIKAAQLTELSRAQPNRRLDW